MCQNQRQFGDKHCNFLFSPHHFFQNHLFVKPSHRPSSRPYLVVNGVCKTRITSMRSAITIIGQHPVLVLVTLKLGTPLTYRIIAHIFLETTSAVVPGTIHIINNYLLACDYVRDTLRNTTCCSYKDNIIGPKASNIPVPIPNFGF